MFFYVVKTPISTTSGLWSTGITRKYHQINVYIYQCVNQHLFTICYRFCVKQYRRVFHPVIIVTVQVCDKFYCGKCWIVLKFCTLVARQKGLDKQCRPRSVSSDWSGCSLFAILTNVLQIYALITNSLQMSLDPRFPTMLYAGPAKAQTSLRIWAVWSEPLPVTWIFYGY